MPTSDPKLDVFREAYTALDDHAPDAPDFDELSAARIDDLEPATQSRRGRGVFVAAAVGVLVLLVGLLNIWLSPEPERSADTRPITTTLPIVESAGSIQWSNPVSEVPRWIVVYELPEGGYIASQVSEPTQNLYSVDGREWDTTQESAVDTVLASHIVEWVAGDFAVGVPVDRSGGGRNLLRYDGEMWQEVAELDDHVSDAADNGEITVMVEPRSDRDVLWVSSPDKAEAMSLDAPWPVSDVASGWRSAYLVFLDDNFVALPTDFYYDGGEEGVLGITRTPGIWLSSDGLTWERAGDNPFATSPVNGLEMRRLGDTLWADTHSGGTASEPDDLFDFWSSTDGITWTLEADDLTGPEHDAFEAQHLGPETVTTPSGQVRVIDDPPGQVEIQRSLDGGVTWESVPPPPTECHRGGYGESTLGITQDFVYCSSDDGFWVGHFDN